MSSTIDAPIANSIRARIDESTGYIENIEDIRRIEFPHLLNTAYLDHAGTTPYASSLVDSYAHDLKSNFFGNPHSASASSQFTTKRVDEIRLQVLRYCNADPDDFDVVFVANATAGIKLVADALQGRQNGFSYIYHEDAHTSLVGVRELASCGSTCVNSDEVEGWLRALRETKTQTDYPTLFAYAGQSNMTGQRYPQLWCQKLRAISKETGIQLYSLYDAAALLSTSALDFSRPDTAPDFTVLSFYKIFGFPDLGALIVRKTIGHMLHQRRYFGGGTVDLVSVGNVPWHARKSQLHSALEDGTLSFHTIIALEHALKVQRRIFGTWETISRHAHYLVSQTYKRLQDLRHHNGTPICEIYSPSPSSCADVGPIIAFNLRDQYGRWVSNSEVEKLSIVNGIQLRTGGLCNPGGIARHLKLSAETMKKNYAAGQRCGGDVDIFDGAPTGAVRISFGASSSLRDVEFFINFLREFFTDRHDCQGSDRSSSLPRWSSTPKGSGFMVASISIFPIKSCGAFSVPSSMDWEVLPKGLKWDREWCLIHQGTKIALSQKQYPRMALLQPVIDFENRQLIVQYADRHVESREIRIDLDEFPETEGVMKRCSKNNMKQANSTVCGQNVLVHLYTSRTVSDFFSDALGVSCTLARFPQDGLQRHVSIRRPASSISTPESSPERGRAIRSPAINLSNESPILLISQSSVNELNRQISAKRAANAEKGILMGRPSRAEITPESFRGNIVIAERHLSQSTDASRSSSNIINPLSPRSDIKSPKSALPQISTNHVYGDNLSEDDNTVGHESPYLEETFKSIRIRDFVLDTLGPCQRCQMVCVDQTSGTRSSEPFSTLAKTRRRAGRVWFGMHMCLAESEQHELSGLSSDKSLPPLNPSLTAGPRTPLDTGSLNVGFGFDSRTGSGLNRPEIRIDPINEANTTKPGKKGRKYFIQVGDPIEVEM